MPQGDALGLRFPHRRACGWIEPMVSDLFHVWPALCPICGTREADATVDLDMHPPYAVYVRLLPHKRSHFPCCKPCKAWYSACKVILLTAAIALAIPLVLGIMHLAGHSRISTAARVMAMLAAYFGALIGLNYLLFGRYYFRARIWLVRNAGSTHIRVAPPTLPRPGELFKEH